MRHQDLGFEKWLSISQKQDIGARNGNKRNGMLSLLESLSGTIFASYTGDLDSIPPFISIIFLQHSLNAKDRAGVKSDKD